MPPPWFNSLFVGARLLICLSTNSESQTNVILHLKIYFFPSQPSWICAHKAQQCTWGSASGQQQNSQTWVKKFNYPSHIFPRLPLQRKLNVDLPIRLAVQWNVIALHEWMGKRQGKQKQDVIVKYELCSGYWGNQTGADTINTYKEFW